MVTPAEPGLETAPSNGEGTVTNVEFEYDSHLLSVAKECQNCGSPVDRERAHIRATVWIITEIRKVELKKNPVFCNRECWAAWATP